MLKVHEEEEEACALQANWLYKQIAERFQRYSYF